MFYKKIVEIIDKDRVLKDEEMSKHTSFKVGGKADFFIIVETTKELIDVLKLTKECNIKTFIIGNGTNLIVKDDGFRGAVIKLNFKKLDIENNQIIAGAGIPLSLLSHFACINSVKNYEFLSGIPGTVGGAVKMNAGAYGGEIKDILISTTYLDKNYNLVEIDNKEHEFDYRQSIFSKKDWIIIESKFKIEYGETKEIEEKINEFNKSRREKQPLDKPNAGSIFKRGEDFITAKLIDEVGLKGYKIGGAMVSTKHAGFIVNEDNATAKDILDLIEYIKQKVKKEKDKDLKLEVLVLGE